MVGPAVTDGQAARGGRVVGSSGAVWLDTDATERAARWWTAHGDQLHRTAFDLEHTLGDLALAEHMSAVRHLTSAATELWNAAALASRATEAATTGDRSFDVAAPADVARLATAVRAGADSTWSSAFGDRGGTGTREIRSPYRSAGATPAHRARSLLERAIADTADARQIRVDEFLVVHLDTGRYVVVLPGVVDLSIPDLGWTDRHRSVRDLDQAAFSSSRSTGLADNAYARMVHDALVDAGVPSGAELLLVGHSFGADTALDLAADETFNGEDGYRVTHVVAAGYHSGPQLPHVPESTAVLVIQNRRDVPVIVEAIGDAHVTDAVVEHASAVEAMLRVDPADAVRHQAAAIGHHVGTMHAAGRHLVARVGDVARFAYGTATRDPHQFSVGLTDLATLEPGVRMAAPGQVISVFDGGGSGFGHRQGLYVDHLHHVDHPAVLEFLESVDGKGYAAPGVAVAVDVSVPS